MKFAERLTIELKGCGLTQRQLAEKLHIDPANITNWKKGSNIPSLQIFYQLCKILDVSADYLLGLID